ncbi:hypothetical protein ACJRO7_023242 [Eucalyptus globulus]|uniref:Uncharacterized protein n=1 Tax=Eucalyptus globulus TaxID=34317 RepID=A0ABD3K4P2_EUCGL
MKRLCSNIFHDVQPQLGSEGDTSNSGSANLMKSVENEPRNSIPNQSQNYVGRELSDPGPFTFDPPVGWILKRCTPVVESNDEHVPRITGQLQNSIEVPASSSDVRLPDEPTSFVSIKDRGHTMDNPSQEPEQSEPQNFNPSSQNLFEVPESSSDFGPLDNLSALDSAKNQLGHSFNDPSLEPTGSQTSDPSSPDLFGASESSSELERLDITFAFARVKNLPGHSFNDSSQEKSESQTRNPSSKNSFEVPESLDMVQLDEPSAFGSVKNQQTHGGLSVSSLGRTDGTLTKEKAAKFWKENAVHGEPSAPEIVGASNTIASSDMSSPVASHEQEAKTTYLESLSNPVEVESYESEILPEVSFQRGSFCDDEVGIERCIPHGSSFTPFALSGGSERTVKEYEQLVIWYEISQIESESNQEIEHTT